MNSRLRKFGVSAAALVCASAAFATTTANLTLSIDTLSSGATIPTDYVGISVSRANISGDGGYTHIFNSSTPTPAAYNEFVALFKQIGIKHIRTVSGGADVGDPDPSPTEDQDFFTFATAAGIPTHDIIYSLHLCNADKGIAGTDNQAAALNIWTNYSSQIQAFALDNEIDFPSNIKDSEIHINTIGGQKYVDYPTYVAEWMEIRDDVRGVVPGAPFAGPDTGSNYPVPNAQDTSAFGPGGTPWTLQLARDQGLSTSTYYDPNFVTATQHYYCLNNEKIPQWTTSTYYGKYDVVTDPTNNEFYISNAAGFAGTSQPHSNSARWQLTTGAGAVCQESPGTISHGRGIWASGGNYAIGDQVQDPSNSYNAFICKAAVSGGTTHPSADTADWDSDQIRNCQGPVQLCFTLLNAQQDTNFATFNTAALRGNHTSSGWPVNGSFTLPYRLTEANAMSGGIDPAAEIFGGALLDLDLFHYFALHYCSGIDPFTRTVQTNATIFFDGTNYTALPYAYAMKAFNLAGPASPENANIERTIAAFTPPAGLTLTAYATGNSANTDVYVTIINKTFNAAGAVDATVKLDTNTLKFAATSASSLLLTSGSPGDASAETATLGGATIPNDGTNFNPTWVTEPITSGLCTVVVQAATAKVVHLHHN